LYVTTLLHFLSLIFTAAKETEQCSADTTHTFINERIKYVTVLFVTILLHFVGSTHATETKTTRTAKTENK
jgi:hypothetical protein